MFSNKVRLALIAGCLLFGTFSLLRNDKSLALMLLVSGACLLYGYFRYGAVWQAFRYVKSGDMVKAEKLLDAIKNPQLLTNSQKSYYFFAKGLIEDDKGCLEKAQACYLQALALPSLTPNNKAIVNLHLAQIYHRRGANKEASERLKLASELPHKPGVAAEIQQLKDLIEMG
jgi:tetratricopeptide (TPR) repeat protein